MPGSGGQQSAAGCGTGDRRPAAAVRSHGGGRVGDTWLCLAAAVIRSSASVCRRLTSGSSQPWTLGFRCLEASGLGRENQPVEPARPVVCRPEARGHCPPRPQVRPPGTSLLLILACSSQSQRVCGGAGPGGRSLPTGLGGASGHLGGAAAPLLPLRSPRRQRRGPGSWDPSRAFAASEALGTVSAGKVE